MLFIELVLLGLFVLFLGSVYWYRTIPKNLPPGPLNLPFIGHPTFLYGNNFYLKLNEWKHRYGSMVSFYVQNQLVVVLNDYDVIKEAFLQQPETFSRRQHMFIKEKLHLDHGLLLTDYGPLWKEQRRFALSTLRDFGFGKSTTENSIVEELGYLSQEIKINQGRPYNAHYLINIAVTNIICQLVFGKRFSYDDQELKRITSNIGALASVPNIMFMKPWMMYIPFVQRKVNQAVNEINKIINFVQKFLDVERSQFQPDNDPTNYIQSFLKAQHAKIGRYFTDLQLQMSVHSLFIAGTDTTSTTLRWGILLCATYPEIQEKVQTELDAVVGPPNDNNAPKLDDRKRLPYCEAVLLELQRYVSLVPFINRYMHESATLNGYTIPEGTVVLRNQFAVHYDPKYFPEPDEFKPERFLDTDGKLLRPETFIPFGIGKRVCLGESLAKMELFLFFTSLMHKFTFSFSDDKPKPSLKPLPTFTRQPQDYEFIARERTQF